MILILTSQAFLRRGGYRQTDNQVAYKGFVFNVEVGIPKKIIFYKQYLNFDDVVIGIKYNTYNIKSYIYIII